MTISLVQEFRVELSAVYALITRFGRWHGGGEKSPVNSQNHIAVSLDLMFRQSEAMKLKNSRSQPEQAVEQFPTSGGFLGGRYWP